MIVAFLDTVHGRLEQRLESAGMTCLNRTTWDREALRYDCTNWDGLVIRSRIRMDAEFLSRCERLRFIARSGAGLENIDRAHCAARGIEVFHAAEGNRDAVGEHALGMLLALWNRLIPGDNEMRQGEWRREANRGKELAGKTVGILGYGRMGSAFAEKLAGFRCRVVAHDAYRKGFGTDRIEEVSLERLWEVSDVLSIHIDQRPGNDYFINAAFLERFAKPVTVINTGRGSTLDTAALVDAMRRGAVEGACLDVFEYEKRSFEALDASALPDALRWLQASERVILSPHVAGWSVESYLKLSEVLADKICMRYT